MTNENGFSEEQVSEGHIKITISDKDIFNQDYEGAPTKEESEKVFKHIGKVIKETTDDMTDYAIDRMNSDKKVEVIEMVTPFGPTGTGKQTGIFHRSQTVRPPGKDPYQAPTMKMQVDHRDFHVPSGQLTKLKKRCKEEIKDL